MQEGTLFNRGHYLMKYGTLGDFRDISTRPIFLLAVAPYNFYNFDTKMVYVNHLFLIVKPIEVKSGFISKIVKKIAKWPHH
jgi:hypothetical protein